MRPMVANDDFEGRRKCFHDVVCQKHALTPVVQVTPHKWSASLSSKNSSSSCLGIYRFPLILSTLDLMFAMHQGMEIKGGPKLYISRQKRGGKQNLWEGKLFTFLEGEAEEGEMGSGATDGENTVRTAVPHEPDSSTRPSASTWRASSTRT
jgi:hypothetical protein